MPAIRSTVTDLRASAARRRALRASHRQLERELAEYRSSAERHELDAILSRHTAEEIAAVEQIVARLHRPGGLVYQR